MKEVAAIEGTRPETVLLEESSMDTLGNAYFCKKLFLEPNGWRLISTKHPGYAKHPEISKKELEKRLS